MGRRERRRFTDEFKAEVVGLVRSGRTAAKGSRDPGLTESAARTGVRRAEGRVGSLSVAEREELSRLRLQVPVLGEERTTSRRRGLAELSQEMEGTPFVSPGDSHQGAASFAKPRHPRCPKATRLFTTERLTSGCRSRSVGAARGRQSRSGC